MVKVQCVCGLGAGGRAADMARRAEIFGCLYQPTVVMEIASRVCESARASGATRCCVEGAASGETGSCPAAL